MTTPDTDRLVAYLLSNRDFLAPAVARAVELLDLPSDGWFLDAGTGAGGGLVALARATGPDARVLGVDRNPDTLELADQHAAEEQLSERVTTRAADLTDLLQEVHSAPDAFDAIWAGDVVWPGNVADPATTVAHMARALAPGGTLALFTSNYYQSAFLPGHSRLERALRTASELTWGLPGGGAAHHERHVHWMVAAGLRDVTLHVVPRVAFPVDTDPAARTYLEQVVCPELRTAARTSGSAAGMSAADVANAEALLTPGTGHYLPDEPGYYLVHPTLLVTGCR